MKYEFSNTIVISLGGSIICPDGINVSFIKKFRIFIKRRAKTGLRFVIVLGGGRLSRVYQEAAGKIVHVTDEDKDWIGIHATRLNAHLIRTIFKKEADPVIIDCCDKIKKLRYPITIASGWRPGWSTDYIAIALAKQFGAKEAIIAGKPSHVFPIRSRARAARPVRALGRATSNGTGDSQFDTEHPFLEMSWKKYRGLIPAKWKPGLHSPVDPVGAKLAQKENIAAIVVDGKNLKNFAALLNGKEFQGTIIDGDSH